MTATQKPTYRRPEWRFRDVLNQMGSANQIHWELFGKGFAPPPDDTIQGWKTRNSIPGKWLLAILEIASDKGIITSIDDLKPRAMKANANIIKQQVDSN